MDELDKFYNKALRFLSFRPRSEYEVKQNLSKKKASENIISKVVSRLKKNNFLNDEEFVKWWIEQRTRFKPRSVRLIKIELKQKGIDKDLIDQIIDDLSLTIDDLSSAKKLMEKRARKYKGLPREEKFQKIARYLSSKGFSYDIIKEIFKEIS
ncbi:MAG: regulatory protein RecX [Patescibacteria group bacterium]